MSDTLNVPRGIVDGANKAWKEGIRARENKGKFSDCPYEDAATKSQWQRGWITADAILGIGTGADSAVVNLP